MGARSPACAVGRLLSLAQVQDDAKRLLPVAYPTEAAM